MNNLYILGSFVSFFYSLSFANGNLELIITLFRHGDRTNEITYPTDPYINHKYAPYGPGQLTNKGRQRMLNLGKKFRRRYMDFISSSCNTNMVDALTTNMTRTQESLKLFLAGLFALKELNETEKFSITVIMNDRVLSFPFLYCPRYRKISEKYFNTKEGQNINLKYAEMRNYIAMHCGIKAPSFLYLLGLYRNLLSENEWGLELPSWTSAIYPTPLQNAVQDCLSMMVATPELNQLQGGFLLQKIVNDIHNKIDEESNSNSKMYIYSGHDTNVVGLLGALDVYYPHIPLYGACVVVELHHVEGVHYVKVLYGNTELRELIVPHCTVLCPLEKFENLLKKHMPGDGDPCVSESSENYIDNRYLKGLNISRH